MRGPAFSPNGAFDKQSRWGKVVGGKGREEKGGKRDHENKLKITRMGEGKGGRDRDVESSGVHLRRAPLGSKTKEPKGTVRKGGL